MANVGIISAIKGEMFSAAHVASMARADSGYFILSGCDVTQSGTPGMSVVVDAGYAQIGYGTARKTVAGGTVTIATSDATYPRIDIIYVDTNGSAQVYAGTPAAITPSSETNYKKFSTPSPGATIPSGAILAIVHVAANATTILNASINDIASYGPYDVEAPTAATTSSYIATWSSTPKTLAVGVAAPTGAVVGTSDTQNLSGKTFTDAPIIDLGASLKEISTPASPSAGYMKLYSKVDEKLYKLSPSGVESEIEPTIFFNNAWNSSFEFFLGTSACLGWWKIGTATITYDTGVRDGYNGIRAIKITSAGSSNEGVSQTLKNLKASTTYSVCVWAKATTGDTAKAWTTGAGTNLSITSTSTTGAYITGFFITDSTPSDVVFKLGSATSTDIVWFDCLTVVEGPTQPLRYFKEKEWDAPIQLTFGTGSGQLLVGTGQLPDIVHASDSFEMLGWELSENSGTSTTSVIDLWKKVSFPPASGDLITATGKPTMTSTTNASSADLSGWTTTEVAIGDYITGNIASNSAGKALTLVVYMRRR